ncbi:MAG: carboxypeptidase-like regulatory domain-containing protein, partial [Candidatus Staskawiczbacteria bacterium]|nr:carboxypeptidase-like regulatory domain-containing protein [Candidatus Staskawiczbacteria bacterium]
EGGGPGAGGVPSGTTIGSSGASGYIYSYYAEKLAQLAEQIAKLLENQTSNISYPPIEEAVPENAPLSLQGWNIMEVKPVSELSLNPVKSDITFFADRIPKFKETLTAFGIDVDSLSDIQKVSGTELYLPGLTQVALTQAEILAINKFEPAVTPATGNIATNNLPSGKISAPEVGAGVGNNKTGITGPGNLAINKFAAVQGVPVASMSTEAKQKIPSDIVFVRSGGELIDYSVAISVDTRGQVQQRINTIAGKPMELVVKPDSPAKSVIGFMTLKKVAVGQTKTSVLGYMTKMLTASLVDSVNQTAPENSGENLLLVKKFAYVEETPGIYKAVVDAPNAEGEYDISTVISAKDINIAPKEIKMTAIVNPEGYVYSQLADGKLRIKGASVSLFWLNPSTKGYELWPADKFLQKNPVLTDDTGKYSFLVPEGTYKIKATAFNYTVFESEPFVMKQDIVVNTDVKLSKKIGWFGWINWQTIITFLLTVLIVYNFWQNEKIRNLIMKIFRFKKVDENIQINK